MNGDVQRTAKGLAAARWGLCVLFVAIQPGVAPQEENLVCFFYLEGFA